ncbi:MAG: hypothetical protein ABJA18_06375 [bacterium]
MSQTLEAIIDEHGAVRLLKPVHLSGTRRALVTILDDQPAWEEGEFDASYRAMAEDEERENEALELPPDLSEKTCAN